jgi:hypothetical protein
VGATFQKNSRQALAWRGHLLPHRLGWEHVNLTGDYIWGTDISVTQNTDGLRPLRPIQGELYQAA